MPEIPHFAFPFARGETGSVNVVEQDTTEHVMACESVIIRCPLGFREERPEFGWPFPTFAVAPLDMGPLRAALARFEPRGDANVEEYADAVDAATRWISVELEA